MSKKASKTKERSIKIKYAANKMGAEELAALVFTIAGVIFFAIPCILMAYDISRPPIIVTILFLLIFICCPGFIYYYEHRKRMVAVKEQKMMIAHGKKVIGSIVSLDYMELGNKLNDKNFVYTIEYEEPNKGEKISLVTPPVIKNKYFIRESDLPLDVVVYCYRGKAFAERIINPPLPKIVTRRFINFISENVRIIITVSIIVALVITGLILEFFDKYILAEIFHILAFLSVVLGIYLNVLYEKNGKQ